MSSSERTENLILGAFLLKNVSEKRLQVLIESSTGVKKAQLRALWIMLGLAIRAFGK